MRNRLIKPWEFLTARDQRARRYLTDTLAHDPNNIVGTYKWNNPNAFSPNNAPFFNVGESFVDPIFGETVYRLTNTSNPLAQLTEEHYSHNAFINADNTLFLWIGATGNKIISIPAGTVQYTGIPISTKDGDTAFDPVNPNVYWRQSGAELRKVTLLGGGTWSDVVFKTFPVTLGTGMSGNQDWIDASGRYFAIVQSGILTVWDSIDDAVFTGGPSASLAQDGGHNAGITPSANHLYQMGPAGTGSVRSYTLNKVNHTIGSPITCYTATPEPHMTVLSASNGIDYIFLYNDNVSNAKIDMDIGFSSITTVGASFNTRNATHYSRAGRGAHRDWAFCSFEWGGDNFDTVHSYVAFDNELVMYNLVTNEVRRLCHTRYRGASTGGNCNAPYYNQPRVCASWDGNVVLWTASFNYNALISTWGYSDLYYVHPTYPASEGGAPSEQRGIPGNRPFDKEMAKLITSRRLS